MKKILFSFLALSLVSVTYPAFANNKEAYKKAKQECLKDKPDLKGKELQKCIHEKSAK